MLIPVLISSPCPFLIDLIVGIASSISNQDNLRHSLHLIDGLKANLHCFVAPSSAYFDFIQSILQFVITTLKRRGLNQEIMIRIVISVGNNGYLNQEITSIFLFFFMEYIIGFCQGFHHNIDNPFNRISHGNSAINSYHSSDTCACLSSSINIQQVCEE